MNWSSTRTPRREDAGARSSPDAAWRALSRRTLIGGAAAVTGASLMSGLWPDGASAHLPGHGHHPKGHGSASGAPNLPAGFADTFTSRYVDTGAVQLHAVIGGDGPPLLLVHGWPETWYAWRLLMPALARDFTVIAVDQRGIGLSEKPRDGYDTGTLAGDLVGLMDALGHEQFALVGHDTGFAISYALASDHPERVARVALAEIPGPPLATHSPPVFVPSFVNDKLWHIPFNRVEKLPEQLIKGREDVYFGYEFAIQGGKVPDAAIEYYVRTLSNPESLHGSLGFYRALDATLAQNADRAGRRMTMPVLAIGGAASYGADVGHAMSALADDVQTAVIEGAGHWVAEEAPDELLAALSTFLAPYRDGSAAVRAASPDTAQAR